MKRDRALIGLLILAALGILLLGLIVIGSNS